MNSSMARVRSFLALRKKRLFDRLHRNRIPLDLPWMIQAHLISRCLYVVAKLRIADLLSDGPRAVADLARATGTDARTLYRVLQALSSLHVFEEGSGERFSIGPHGQQLLSDAPFSLRAWIVLNGEAEKVYGTLLECVKSGRNGFDILVGKHSWEVLVDENARALFDEAMSTWTRFHATEIVRAYDFSQFRQLVDIGGNRGVLLTTLLNVNPGLKGVVFDRVEVAEEARLWIASAGLTDRCSFVVGDFFGSVPQSDGYVVKHVLHDWSDERALQVLRNVRASIEPNGRLLVIEGVLMTAA
jgi:hypothetical protein